MSDNMNLSGSPLDQTRPLSKTEQIARIIKTMTLDELDEFINFFYDKFHEERAEGEPAMDPDSFDSWIRLFWDANNNILAAYED